MANIESNESLRPLVVIFGHNLNDFSWKVMDSRSVYQTNGLIFSHNDKFYVLTTRSRLNSCKNITMYYSHFDKSSTVMRNDLRILFQSIEFNIIILGSLNRSSLDLSTSDCISGLYETMSDSYTISNLFVLPRKNGNYAVRMNMDLDTHTINYEVNIHELKFIKGFVYDETFLPAIYLYEFTMTVATNAKMNGICGCSIFNKKQQLIGTIYKSIKLDSRGKKYKLYVLPTKAINKILIDGCAGISKPDTYSGLFVVNFDWTWSNNTVIKILSSGGPSFKNQDEIITINQKKPLMHEGQVSLYDDDFKSLIPLDIYLKLNSLSFVISRKKKIIKFDLVNNEKNISKFKLELTSQPHFFPTDPIPFVNIHNIIIVQLTHELLDLTILNKITLKNPIIDDYMDNSQDITCNYLLVIDCLDDLLQQKYDLPRIIPDKKLIIKCPIVRMINGKNISTLNEIGPQEKIHTISLGTLPTDMSEINI
jgi:hypothetical protein